jgi:hypothetical protein
MEMNTVWRFGVVVSLLLAGVAGASGIVTVRDAMNYEDNSWDENAGVWFLIPREISEDPCNWHEDYSPWHRTSNEDWGWMHDVADLVPADANGIESATLAIEAWDVDSSEGEDDVIFVNSRYVGTLTGVDRDWKTVTYKLPASLLDDLWKNAQLHVYMDIDQILEVTGGFRVTLGSSTLTVNYTTTGARSNRTPVYRFWSPVTLSHFYTADEAERDMLIDEHPHIWSYEGTAYQAPIDAGDIGASPVYRFWSPTRGGHLYTIDETEKNTILAKSANAWTYEGVAFHAFASAKQAAGTAPVYRFQSLGLGYDFYTVDETEKRMLMDKYSAVWTYKGIAWYAYAP